VKGGAVVHYNLLPIYYLLLPLITRSPYHSSEQLTPEWEYWKKIRLREQASGNPTLKWRSVVMWHRFKNLVFSLKTYDALSPDLKMRQQVNRMLRQRPALNLEQWFESFYQPLGITYAVADFAYGHLAQYSGLEVGCLLPSDRLEDDLHWTQVCWFDWQLNLYDDFWQRFEVDISDCFDESALLTVKDLMAFLNDCSAQA
jgi:hypothetical protein